jgi:NTP pyrophosphatase (non-canonical NTP hydrolase)
MTDSRDGEGPLMAPSPFAAIQDLAKAYMPILNPNEVIQYASTGLATESAEVLDLYKKAIGGVLPLDRARVIEELGDVFYAGGMLMLMEDITLEEVCEVLAAKLREIYPRGHWDINDYRTYRRAKHGGKLK